jgi:hypothetical protein
MRQPKHTTRQLLFDWTIRLAVGVAFAFGYCVMAVMMPIGVVGSLCGQQSPAQVADTDWTCGGWREHLPSPEDRWESSMDHPRERHCRFTELLHNYDFVQVRFVNKEGQTAIQHQSVECCLNPLRAWSFGLALFGLWVVLCCFCRPH